MKDLNEILVFARVVQDGGFGKAAKSLGMPVSTVSRRVSDLEARLGITLLQRTTRKLQLTRAGARYYPACADLIEGLDEAEARVSRFQKRPEGPLRVTVPVGLASGTFIDFVSMFLRKYPGIELDLMVTNDIVDLVAEHVDLALRAGALDDSSLVARRLGIGEDHLVASPAFIKEHGQPRTPQELREFECLSYGSRSEDHVWELSRDRARHRVRVRGRISATDMTAVRELALRGHGIAALPGMYCLNELKSGDFKRILPEWRLPPAPFHAVYPDRKFMPARVAAFLDELDNWSDPEWKGRLK